MGFHEIDVLQSTAFPISCHDVKITQNALISIGTYKPCMKIHNLNELSLKSDRNLENEPLKVEPLNEDGTKVCVLRTDRYIELHAKFGYHSSYRIPSQGRNIQFNHVNADLLTQSDDAIYLFNLEEGRFKKPIEHENIVNMHLSTTNGILAVACIDKTILYDYRSMECITEFGCKNTTAVQFGKSGIDFCLNEGNIVKIKDLRMNDITYAVECNGYIKALRCNNNMVCALDNDNLTFIVDGNIKWNIHQENINAFDFDGNVFFLGCENGCIKIFHNPEIENEPEWCRLVDLPNSKI